MGSSAGIPVPWARRGRLLKRVSESVAAEGQIDVAHAAMHQGVLPAQRFLPSRTTFLRDE